MTRAASHRAGPPTAAAGRCTPNLQIGAEEDAVAAPGSHAIPCSSIPSTTPKAYLALEGASHLAPNSPNTVIASNTIAWLKRYVDNDTRYTQFLCRGPSVSYSGPVSAYCTSSVCSSSLCSTRRSQSGAAAAVAASDGPGAAPGPAGVVQFPLLRPTEGGSVAATVPAGAVVLAAARQVHAGRRLELGVLARELGTSRVTLHRRVGSREQLLSRALVLLADRTCEQGEQRWEQARASGEVPAGALRSLFLLADFTRSVAHDPGIRRLLEDEPAMAVRLLTDPRGMVQPRTIETVAALLQHDVAAGDLDPLVEVGTLSYAVVRLTESFLYSDVLASRRPDLDACEALVNALVTGVPVSGGPSLLP